MTEPQRTATRRGDGHGQVTAPPTPPTPEDRSLLRIPLTVIDQLAAILRREQLQPRRLVPPGLEPTYDNGYTRGVGYALGQVQSILTQAQASIDEQAKAATQEQERAAPSP